MLALLFHCAGRLDLRWSNRLALVESTCVGRTASSCAELGRELPQETAREPRLSARQRQRPTLALASVCASQVP